MSERRREEVTGIAAGVSRGISENSDVVCEIMLNVTEIVSLKICLADRGVEGYEILAGESHGSCCHG